jgi:hypothetical protein
MRTFVRSTILHCTPLKGKLLRGVSCSKHLFLAYKLLQKRSIHKSQQTAQHNRMQWHTFPLRVQSILDRMYLMFIRQLAFAVFMYSALTNICTCDALMRKSVFMDMYNLSESDLSNRNNTHLLRVLYPTHS